jgi:hypothetical protein
VELERSEEDPGRRMRCQALFRAVNVRLRELNVEFEDFAGETPVFVCECHRLDCIEVVKLRWAAFDALCSTSSRFALVPGHDSPDLETVVERAEGYVIVEKRPPA